MNLDKKRKQMTRQLAILRQQHTRLFASEKYSEMQTVGYKIKHQLDAIIRTFPNWKENDDEARQYILDIYRGKTC